NALPRNYGSADDNHTQACTSAHADMTGRNQTPAETGAPLRLAGMSWTHFLNDGAANFLPGVLPAILVSLQLPVTWAGALMTALMIGQGLQPFVGIIADRIGGRSLSLLGLCGSSLGAGLIGIVGNTTALIAVLALIGISNALFHPQAVSGVRQLASSRQGLAISSFLIGGEIGRGVWPMLAGLCVMLGGLQWLTLLALPGLASLPLLYRCAPSLAQRHRDAAPIAWSQHAGPVMRLVAFCGVRAFITYTITLLLPLLWQQGGGELTTGASLITVCMVVGGIGNLSGGWLAGHLGSHKLLLAAMLLATVTAAALGTTAGIWLWPLAALLGIALFATPPLTV